MLVAGVDGARGGWAVVVSDNGRLRLSKALTFAEIFETHGSFDIVAVDMPIGLTETYEPGGRACERAARKMLGRGRASSVFPSPARAVLEARTHKEACEISRGSMPGGKGISVQSFGILPKIKEVDLFLRKRPDLRDVVREVHPEVCFHEMAQVPMKFSKKKPGGKAERTHALRVHFPEIDAFVAPPRTERLPLDDVLDATAACWTAQRLAAGNGCSLIEPVLPDATGLKMTIWV